MEVKIVTRRGCYFCVREKIYFRWDWFAPKYEVDLCGYAAIAASEILFNKIGIKSEEIILFLIIAMMEQQ